MRRVAAKTGRGPMAVVAIEQCFPFNQRIVRDELAQYCSHQRASCDTLSVTAIA